MPYIGKCECQQPFCGREVDVYENRAGMAYYNCGPCGVRVQQKTARGNAQFMATVRREAADEAPADAGNSREIAEPKPAEKAPAKPAKRGILASSIFGG